MTRPITDFYNSDTFFSTDSLMKGLIWADILDNRYLIEVHDNETDSKFVGKLFIFDHKNDCKVVHEEDVDLISGAIFGPDISDIDKWQQIAMAAVDKETSGQN